MEPEEEEISYLTDMNKVPDFIDDPPVEIHEVSICCFCVLIIVWIMHNRVQRRRQSKRQVKEPLHGHVYIYIHFHIDKILVP